MSQLEDVVSSIKPLEVQGLFPQKQGGEGVWELSSIDFFQTKRIFPGFIFPHSLLFVCLEEGDFKLQRLVCHMAQSGNSAIPYWHLIGDKLEIPFLHLWVGAEPFTFVSCVYCYVFF